MWANRVKNNQEVNEDTNEDMNEDTNEIESEYFPEEGDQKIQYSKKTIAKRVNNIKFDVIEDDEFGWNIGTDPTVFAQRVIKRFRLKKLKSLNGEAYYYDNVSYHIWQYSKDSVSGVEKLSKPSDNICKKLRELNKIDGEWCMPYMWQPEEFW